MGDRRAVSSETAGALLVALAALCFGGTVIFGKLLANRDFPVTSMLSIRFGSAALLLAAWMGLRGRSIRPAPGEGRRVLALGAIGYASESALFFLGLKHGAVSAVTLLFFTYPVWVTALSTVLGLASPGLVLTGALTATVAGAALVVGGSGELAITGAGIAFALGSSLAFSLYLIGADVALTRTSPMASAMWVAGTASASLGLLAVASGSGRLPADGAEWGSVLGMGALTAAAFTALFGGLRRLGAVRTSVIAALEPVAAAGFAAGFLGEPLRAATIAGGILILSGAVAATLARQRPEPAVP